MKKSEFAKNIKRSEIAISVYENIGDLFINFRQFLGTIEDDKVSSNSEFKDLILGFYDDLDVLKDTFIKIAKYSFKNASPTEKIIKKR